MSAASSSFSPVTIVDVPTRFVAVVRRDVSFAEMGEAQRRARPLLQAALQAAEIAPASPPLTVWRMTGDGRVDYAPGVFVAQPLAATGEVSLLTLPAGQAAHLTLTGGYDQLPAAWERLFAGCAGRTRTGLNWEVYPAQNADAAKTDLYSLLT